MLGATADLALGNGDLEAAVADDEEEAGFADPDLFEKPAVLRRVPTYRARADMFETRRFTESVDTSSEAGTSRSAGGGFMSGGRRPISGMAPITNYTPVSPPSSGGFDETRTQSAGMDALVKASKKPSKWIVTPNGTVRAPAPGAEPPEVTPPVVVNASSTAAASSAAAADTQPPPAAAPSLAPAPAKSAVMSVARQFGESSDAPPAAAQQAFGRMSDPLATAVPAKPAAQAERRSDPLASRGSDAQESTSQPAHRQSSKPGRASRPSAKDRLAAVRFEDESAPPAAAPAPTPAPPVRRMSSSKRLRRSKSMGDMPITPAEKLAEAGIPPPPPMPPAALGHAATQLSLSFRFSDERLSLPFLEELLSPVREEPSARSHKPPPSPPRLSWPRQLRQSAAEKASRCGALVAACLPQRMPRCLPSRAPRWVPKRVLGWWRMQAVPWMRKHRRMLQQLQRLLSLLLLVAVVAAAALPFFGAPLFAPQPPAPPAAPSPPLPPPPHEPFAPPSPPLPPPPPPSPELLTPSLLLLLGSVALAALLAAWLSCFGGGARCAALIRSLRDERQKQRQRGQSARLVDGADYDEEAAAAPAPQLKQKRKPGAQRVHERASLRAEDHEPHPADGGGGGGGDDDDDDDEFARAMREAASLDQQVSSGAFSSFAPPPAATTPRARGLHRVASYHMLDSSPLTGGGGGGAAEEEEEEEGAAAFAGAGGAAAAEAGIGGAGAGANGASAGAACAGASAGGASSMSASANDSRCEPNTRNAPLRGGNGPTLLPLARNRSPRLELSGNLEPFLIARLVSGPTVLLEGGNLKGGDRRAGVTLGVMLSGLRPSIISKSATSAASASS